MKTKVILFAGVLAATAAMAVPATAGAAPTLTMPSGTPIPTGTAVTFTLGTGFTHPVKFGTAVGDATCVNIMINAQVTANSSGHVHISGTPGSTSSGCTLNGVAATVSEINLISNDSTTPGSGTFELSLKIEIPGGVTCSLTNAGEPGAFTYTVGSSTASISPTEMFSAACGETELSGETRLETPNGEAIIRD